MIMMSDQYSHSPNVAESRVLIIMTGGTICMRRSPNGYVPARGFMASCMSPRPSFNDLSSPADVDVIVNEGISIPHKSLRTPISTYQKHVRFACYEFPELLDSSSISADGWTQISQTIHRNYTLFDAFVVLHGTDSLAYTCSALSFMLQNLGKPVVLTGSQAPMLELQNDATDNLLGSLIIAGHFMIPEVCLFFNHNLLRGNRSTKVSASDFAAFESPNFPPLATISSLKTHVNWDIVRRATNIEPFNIQTNRATGDVACLRIFPGMRPEMVDAVLRLDGLKALVLETFGAGNTPSGRDGALTRVFADAIQRGIIVVSVTQCMTGSVSPLYEPAKMLERAGVIPGYDMTSEAALTKLSYLLALPGIGPQDVAEQMSLSLRGELTKQCLTTFQHPAGVMSSPLADLTRLSYAISNGNIDETREILEKDSWRLLNEADYLGNTPLHIAAAGPDAAMLRLLLSKGASVHLRNKSGQTPLFVAAQWALGDNVALLRKSGAHLGPEELPVARSLAPHAEEIWHAAGL